MRKLSFFLAACAATLAAQAIYIPVDAPFAQNLVVATKNAHPELQKLGLHAIPPGQHDYAIIANAITSKIGKKSSAADLTVLQKGGAEGVIICRKVVLGSPLKLIPRIARIQTEAGSRSTLTRIGERASQCRHVGILVPENPVCDNSP